MNPAQPKFLKGGLILIDPDSGAVRRTLPMLVNPSTLTRSFEIRSMGDGGGASSPLRLIGPAVETINVEARLDAADAIARGAGGTAQGPLEEAAAEHGVRPWIAALQMLITPSSDALTRNDALQQSGALEIVPMIQSLTLFVWGTGNILPVRVTSLSVTEDFFDPELRPISAQVTLGLRSLSVDDLGFAGRGGAIYMAYLREQEARAARLPDGRAADLGVEGAL